VSLVLFFSSLLEDFKKRSVTMSMVLTAIGVPSPHFNVISRIVIVAVTANPAFLFLFVLLSSWQGKVQKKNE